jgi:SEC-C motif domain protein
MRARYSAHAVHDEPYLLDTWDPATRPDHVDFDASVRWTRLEVLATTGGNLLDTQGTVEFLAHYTDGDGVGQSRTHHELSRFVRNDQRWAYLGLVGEPLA